MGDTIKSVEGLTFTPNDNPFAEPAVAKIGDKGYTTLEAAVAAAVASSQANSAAEVTVTLLNDFGITK